MKSVDIIKCDMCFFSYDGLFLIYTVINKIFVIQVKNFELYRIYIESYKIDDIILSNDNIHFLTLIKNKGCVCIYSFYKNNLINKISDYFQTYDHSFFLSKNNNIGVVKYEKQCLSIYNMNNPEKCLINIENMKYQNKGYCWNYINTIFACLIENKKDINILLLSLFNYNIIKNIKFTNFFPNDILFSRSDHIIAYSNKNKSLHIYSTDGDLLYVYKYAEDLASINIVSINKMKNILSLGLENGYVKIMDLENFKEIKSFLLDSTIQMNDKLNIYKENISTKDPINDILSTNITSKRKQNEYFSFYTNVSEGIKEGEYKLKSEKVPVGATTKAGITFLCFSICANYLAVLSENHNNVVRIYETKNYSCIAILQQRNKVTFLKWDNILYKPRLLICTSTCYLFMWLPFECAVIKISHDFMCKEAEWNNDGTLLLTKNDNSLALFYPRKK
ncbi:conserved Plasmodium protein, unknown function [Plasmodium gaboni]|uniref:WD repeat-containing protein WRAP73 n=1 Tax=Plasmodium gaboni TaxID=647221 RepID=A0ABY1UPI5_9APIC|nr:conserved Plasmodium protein, unknown function [Plasmodium gaboni]